MDNKELFLKECTVIKRDGFQNLLDWLEKSDFYYAPASTKYHGNYRGGLLEHSLNVCVALKELVSLNKLDISDESLAIVSLFHDICKTNYYKEGKRNVKNEKGQWVEKTVYEVDEKFPCGDHADKSIIILQQYIKLTPDEIFAIRAHMGAWDNASKGGSYFIDKIFEKSPLAVLLHLADMTATYLLEGKTEVV